MPRKPFHKTRVTVSARMSAPDIRIYRISRYRQVGFRQYGLYFQFLNIDRIHIFNLSFASRLLTIKIKAAKLIRLLPPFRFNTLFTVLGIDSHCVQYRQHGYAHVAEYRYPHISYTQCRQYQYGDFYSD